MTTVLSIPTLETERLILRAPMPKDLPAFTEFCASPRAGGIGGPFPDYVAHKNFCALVGHWHVMGYGRWIVADKADDTPLGVVGLMYPPDWPEPEIAWSLFEAGEGRGIAYEAALATRTYAYDVLGWATVMSCTKPDNDRSIALARRMGARHERDFEHAFLGTLHVWRHLSPEEVA